ncbi:CYFA0S24e00210g1_1 [Cyberlindnera fabianii]|uniref:Anaphase-promoting complex subunit 10 n=1 Tax=Cyberlindnera fabianii TaxID=36022 RepID=A0A061BFB7_CYBFA|nr:CYFA0S24e00210g1_1 [Cyberlindnera fabianii]
MSDSWQDLPEESTEAQEDFRDSNSEFIDGLREAEDNGLVDIGALGAWSVSTYKQGSGVKELRDDSPETFWQSDGMQPHHLDVHFSKKVTISRVSLFTDYSLDESYTPSKIHILTGNGFHDLVEVVTLNLDKPTGWTTVVFSEKEDDSDGLKTFLLRLNIAENHQHGKDTHLRALKIYSKKATFTLDHSVIGPFTSRKLLAESTIR